MTYADLAIEPTMTSRKPVSIATAGVPLLVRDETAHAPSGPMTVPLVKVVFAVSGWAQVHAHNGAVFLKAGSIRV